MKAWATSEPQKQFNLYSSNSPKETFWCVKIGVSLSLQDHQSQYNSSVGEAEHVYQVSWQSVQYFIYFSHKTSNVKSHPLRTMNVWKPIQTAGGAKLKSKRSSVFIMIHIYSIVFKTLKLGGRLKSVGFNLRRPQISISWQSKLKAIKPTGSPKVKLGGWISR